MPPRTARKSIRPSLAPEAAFAAEAPAAPAPAPLGAPAAEAAPLLPAPGGWWTGLGLLLAFAEPSAGLALALLYWPQAGPKARSFGRWCLALAVLGAVLGAAFGAADGAIRGGGWTVEPWY